MSLQEAEDGVRGLLGYCGDDVRRDGVLDTPRRVVAAFRELTWGMRVAEVTFLDQVSRDFESSYDEVIALRRIPFVSLCEHHLLPIIGRATVAYIPQKGGRVLGLSKIARVVGYYAARFQIQEQLTKQIADAMEKLVQPTGVAVYIAAEHLCMSIRGVGALGSEMVTHDFRGAFRDAGARTEFLALCRNGG